jgi:hypothetical protein
MSLAINTTGSFDRTDRFLSHMSKGSIFDALEGFAERGVAELAAATPSDSGAAAAAWSYEVEKKGGTYSIYWTNNNLDKTGTPIVILLQHGHATGTGGYVIGRDFINPAIRPIFDEISDSVWKAVTSS